MKRSFKIAPRHIKSFIGPPDQTMLVVSEVLVDDIYSSASSLPPRSRTTESCGELATSKSLFCQIRPWMLLNSLAKNRDKHQIVG